MMGLFLSGTTSLVESSAVGAALATIAAAIEGKLTFKVIEDTTRNTLSSAACFSGSSSPHCASARSMTGSARCSAIETLLLNTWDLSPWAILIAMLFSFLVMGAFLDDTAMLVIVAPLYIPLVGELDFNLIWFGILYTITCQVAYITPPFGYNLFLMRAHAPPEITIGDIYRSIVPFFFLMVLTIIIILLFPQIALWLPISTRHAMKVSRTLDVASGPSFDRPSTRRPSHCRQPQGRTEMSKMPSMNKRDFLKKAGLVSAPAARNVACGPARARAQAPSNGACRPMPAPHLPSMWSRIRSTGSTRPPMARW